MYSSNIDDSPLMLMVINELKAGECIVEHYQYGKIICGSVSVYFIYCTVYRLCGTL